MAIQTTKKVLSLPGGGIRGYLQTVFIDILINHYPFVAPFSDNFDVICGTSIGCINALGISAGKPISQLSNLFLNDGPWIFTIRTAEDIALDSDNASEPSNLPDGAQKAAFLIENDPFYKAVSINSNYGHTRLYDVIDTVLGDVRLNELNTNVLLTAFDTTTSQPVLFSNYTGNGYIGSNELAANVAKASSAAPVYLPTYSIGDIAYADGGLGANDPSQYGLTLAKRIGAANGEDVTRTLVLDIGTGVLPPEDWATNYSGIPFVGAGLQLSKVIKATLAGSNILAANDLYYRDKYTTDDVFSYNYAPVLNTALYDPGLDNSSPAFLNYMYNLAYQWFDNDRANIDEFMGKFFA